MDNNYFTSSTTRSGLETEKRVRNKEEKPKPAQPKRGYA